jgi:hypothetical protein
VAGSGEQSRGEGGRAHGGNEVREDSSMAPTHGDKVTNPRGAIVTGLTGGRCHICHQSGHQLVIGYVAEGAGPGCPVKPFCAAACGLAR